MLFQCCCKYEYIYKLYINVNNLLFDDNVVNIIENIYLISNIEFDIIVNFNGIK